MPNKTLYINSDSHFSALYQAGPNRFPLGANQTAPALIAKKYGLDAVNESLPGGSNQRIIRTSKEYLRHADPENTVVFIGWTQWSRTEWFYQGQWLQVNDHPMYQEHAPKDPDVRSFWAGYSQKVFTLYPVGEKPDELYNPLMIYPVFTSLMLDWQSRILDFHDWLEDRGFRHIFLHGDQGFVHTPMDLTWPEGLWLGDDPYNWDYSFCNYSRYKGYHWVRLAKVALSEQVSLPVFSGRGWEEAERLLKAGDGAEFERIHAADEPAEADFDGFECRWQHVPSVRGHKLSLIVAATSTDAAVNQATYRRVLAALQERVGDTEQHHPLRVDQLNLTFRSGLLSNESRVRTHGQGWLARWRYILRLYGLNLAGKWLFWRRAGDPADRWGRYRADLVRQTDHRKFDGALRTVLDVSDDQEVLLRDWLESERRGGSLVYGMHRSSEALITCLVESYDGKHMHFVDGSDGGYALAARQLKAQLAAWQPTA